MQAAGMAPQPQPRWLLIEARNKRGWSQQELADLIGTTHVNVSRWERGITRPTPYFRRKLCECFSKSEQELDLAIMPADTPVPPATLPLPPGTPVSKPIYDPAIPALPPTHLVGRESALSRVKSRLFAGGSVALSALNGLPGIGKTALSITLAHDSAVREHFRDGVLWAALGPHPDIASQLSHWGTLLGMPAPEMAALGNSDAWAKALRLAIGPRAMLLVIDDAWHLEDALACKVGGPNCAHLVTTRFPGIASHIAFGGAMTLPELSEDEGYELLCLLAPDVVAIEEQMARNLVRAVGGLPLALTLIGNYLRKQAYSGPARRVRAALELLNTAEARLTLSEPQTPAESHASLAPDVYLSLQSVIDVTVLQLGQDARAALYALSVFPPKPSSFSEEAALAVAACALAILDALLDAGLLESNSSGRYSLHQVIADYARLRLDENASSAAYTRLISYMADYVVANRKEYELLELESSAILAALEDANQPGKQSELVRIATAFAPFLLSRGIYQTAEQHMWRAHEAACAVNDARGIATTLLYLGEIAQKQGHYVQAESSLQEGLAIARNVNDSERISALLTNLGWVALKRGEYTQAETYLQEGLQIASQLGNRERIAALLEMLGSVFGSRGDYARSETHLQEGLAIARALNDRERMCTILINLGATAAEQGHDAQAIPYMKEGLALARAIGHREWIVLLLLNLGEVSIDQNDYSRAESYFSEGLMLARQIGHREWISILLINLGAIIRNQGHYSHAERHLQEGLALAQEIRRPRITSNALYEYGNLYLNSQQIDQAELIFREMQITLPEGDQELLALKEYGLAQVNAARGNFRDARRHGETSIAALKAIGHRRSLEISKWMDSLPDQI